MLDTLWQDIRYATRLMLKDRGFAAATVTILASALPARRAASTNPNIALAE